MSETKFVQAIYFGPSDDTKKKVFNVIIHQTNGEMIDVLRGQKEAGYQVIRVLRTCDHVWISFEKDRKMIDEMYIPTNSISKILVHHSGS